MTGRTHDLAAFTALNSLFILMPLQEISLATLAVTIGANFIGGLAPDLDSSTSSLWKHVRGGRIVSQILSPLLGGHRLISHSLLGLIIAAYGVNFFLNLISNILLVDMFYVWIGFMVGMISHLATDAMTKEGIPFFFPLPFTIGFPPIKRLRITTGKLLEKSFIYPSLMIINGYFFFTHSGKYLDFLRNFIN